MIGLSGFFAALAGRAATWLSADTIVVDINGGGDFTVIQNALDIASQGDVIEVRPGDYAGFTVAVNGVTIRGSGPDTCRIYGVMDGITVNEGFSCEISGFYVTGRHGVYLNNVDNCTLKHLVISGCTGDGLRGTPSELTLLNCVMSENGGAGVRIVSSYGFDPRFNFANNVIAYNGTYGIHSARRAATYPMA